MEQPARPTRLDRAYQAIFREEDGRVCTDIEVEACDCVPRNFFLIGTAHTLSNLGDHLANPKTVLAWMLGFVGAPASIVSLLVPIRESLSMVPQIMIAGFVRRRAVRKYVWVLGAVLQALAVLGMAFAAATFRGATAGWIVLGLVALFSLSRGLNSVASKDVLGKTVPKTRRGRLTGFGATASGVAAVFLGLWLSTIRAGSESVRPYVILLIFAAGIWLLAAAVYATVREFAGETEGGRNALVEALRRLDLLHTDRTFRRFVITRALLLCSALSAPYYVLLAQEQVGANLKTLAAFVLANGLAASVSASFWGAMADTSSRRVLIRAATMAAVLGLAVFALATIETPLRHSGWTYAAAFFFLSIAHSGVRLGRKTYIVDMAGGNRRTDYVAVSNTVIGAILLLTGLIAPLATVIHPAGMILVLSCFGFVGAATGSSLPEVE